MTDEGYTYTNEQAVPPEGGVPAFIEDPANPGEKISIGWAVIDGENATLSLEGGAPYLQAIAAGNLKGISFGEPNA